MSTKSEQSEADRMEILADVPPRDVRGHRCSPMKKPFHDLQTCRCEGCAALKFRSKQASAARRGG